MGIEYAIACAECKEFIDLHKWPIIDDAARTLITAFGLEGGESSGDFSEVVPENGARGLVVE